MQSCLLSSFLFAGWFRLLSSNFWWSIWSGLLWPHFSMFDITSEFECSLTWKLDFSFQLVFTFRYWIVFPKNYAIFVERLNRLIEHQSRPKFINDFFFNWTEFYFFLSQSHIKQNSNRMCIAPKQRQIKKNCFT